MSKLSPYYYWDFNYAMFVYLYPEFAEDQGEGEG